MLRVAFGALGWEHRELLSSPWGAAFATLLAGRAAIRFAVRRGWAARSQRRAPKRPAGCDTPRRAP
jgi:hypothetical protein